MLHKNIFIRRLLAGTMLVLFAFSITPRNVLHALFANHTDETSLSKRSGTSQVKTFDYLCKCDNSVVESPFIQSMADFEVPVFLPFPLYTGITPYFFYATGYFFFEHRGPPAIA